MLSNTSYKTNKTTISLLWLSYIIFLINSYFFSHYHQKGFLAGADISSFCKLMTVSICAN
ncbi:hypothetical protein TPENAI_30043 [Tenacibaculum litopenaei]